MTLTHLVSGHPDNRKVLEVIGSFSNDLVGPENPLWSCPGEQAEDPGYGLGCHPDLVAHVWETLPQGLPRECRWVLAARPCLVHPGTGVVFLFASGQSLYGLRLGPADRHDYQEAAAAQAHSRAESFGLEGAAREKYLLHHTGDRLVFSSGAGFEVSSLGPDWVIGRSLADEREWVLRSFTLAGQGA